MMRKCEVYLGVVTREGDRMRQVQCDKPAEYTYIVTNIHVGKTVETQVCKYHAEHVGTLYKPEEVE